MLGLGERTGCAPLEQLAAFLSLICNDTKKNIKSLKKVADYIADISKRPIHANQPVFGHDIFTCETGLHLQGLLKKPATYEPFPPEEVGATRKLLIGSKSGKYAIQKQVQLLGQDELSEHVLEKCVQLVTHAASELGRSLSHEELLAICKT
jgi:homocitrate synthase NifV